MMTKVRNMITVCIVSALLVSHLTTNLIAQESKTTLPEANEYKTVTIGLQQWMTENLYVGTFRNGEPIPEAKTKAEWEAAYKNESAAWCYYNNDPKIGEKYSKLYNWYAVNEKLQFYKYTPLFYALPARGIS